MADIEKMDALKTTGLSSKLGLWVEEALGDFAAMRYRVTETIFSGHSDFQQVDLVATEGHGKMLFIDGLVMVSERDEFVYHDMIAHVPLFTHPDPRRVLIIGGGDGGTAREVLRHPGVRVCTMVEIDGLVVEVCKKYLPQTACALDDPRLTLRIEDGVKYMAETSERFEVVIVDSTDPIGPAAPLFGESFYANVSRVLSEDGLVVAQGESPFYEPEAQKVMLTNIGKSFPKAYMYNYSNLTYPGGLWSFVLASKGPDPLAGFDPDRVRRSGLNFAYYGANLHRAAFCLPRFQQDHLRGVIENAD